MSGLNTLWIGDRLGWVPRLCLSSWVRHGHRVTLWTYRQFDDVPSGVNVESAEAILPASAVVRHRATGSLSLFSNRFRYHLLTRDAVTWIDTDVILLRPLPEKAPYLYGWEWSDTINTAILRLPPDSPALAELKAFTDARAPVPPWWSDPRKQLQRSLARIGLHKRPQDMPWGTFGPRALTDAILRHRLDTHAAPKEVFYPVNWRDAGLFHGPTAGVYSRFTPATIAVHLWQSSDAMRAHGDAPPIEGSFLAEMCADYGIDCGR